MVNFNSHFGGYDREQLMNVVDQLKFVVVESQKYQTGRMTIGGRELSVKNPPQLLKIYLTAANVDTFLEKLNGARLHGLHYEGKTYLREELVNNLRGRGEPIRVMNESGRELEEDRIHLDQVGIAEHETTIAGILTLLDKLSTIQSILVPKKQKEEEQSDKGTEITVDRPVQQGVRQSHRPTSKRLKQTSPFDEQLEQQITERMQVEDDNRKRRATEKEKIEKAHDAKFEKHERLKSESRAAEIKKRNIEGK